MISVGTIKYNINLKNGTLVKNFIEGRCLSLTHSGVWVENENGVFMLNYTSKKISQTRHSIIENIKFWNNVNIPEKFEEYNYSIKYSTLPLVIKKEIFNEYFETSNNPEEFLKCLGIKNPKAFNDVDFQNFVISDSKNFIKDLSKILIEGNNEFVISLISKDDEILLEKYSYYSPTDSNTNFLNYTKQWCEIKTFIEENHNTLLDGGIVENVSKLTEENENSETPDI